MMVLFVNCIVTNFKMINDGEYYLSNNANINEINSITSYKYNLDYNHDELGGAEYLPYTEKMDYNNDSLAIKCIDNNGQAVDYIYDYNRLFSKIEFTCDNQKDLKLLLPLSYYKGYKAYELIDNQWVMTNISYSPVFKEILIDSKAGTHIYKVLYKGTAVQKISLIVSAVTLITLIIYRNRSRTL